MPSLKMAIFSPSSSSQSTTTPFSCSPYLRFSHHPPSFPLNSTPSSSMALKAVHVSDVPNLDHLQQNPTAAATAFYATRLAKGSSGSNCSFTAPKFVVIGHRGHGMNLLQSSDPRMKAFKENSILSFNAAADTPIDYVEFDVQVTKDGCPVIFHDNSILSEEQDSSIFERRVTDLSLQEFLTYGPQKETVGKHLIRKTKDGKFRKWNVDKDDTLCTLQDAFEKVHPRLGFNIELKFDDYVVYDHDQLNGILTSILQVVVDHGNGRPVIFSSFQPDASLLMRKLQSDYPVFFLTNGGSEMYYDVRRNTLEEALKLCLEGGLQGVVSEVKAIFKNPGAVSKIKESKLSLLTYGQLNNVPEAVYMQHLMGVDGVIVDLVEEITQAISGYNLIKAAGEEEVAEREQQGLQFSERELAFLLKLIPELIQK